MRQHTAVSPSAGPLTAGTVVTVTGTNLTGATITFGAGHPATAVSCTATTCTATAPAGTPGTVDVQATTPGGTSATSTAGTYTYAAADLGITLSATGVPGILGLFGGHIDYTITAKNNGPSTLTTATVTANLPYPMIAGSSDCASGTGPVTCTITNLASGATTTRHFSVPVGLLTLGLPYAVTIARTASAPIDLTPANDHATQTCAVITSLIISCH
ncbi:IPT/TIG domain-containing protein [Kitasatospora purpeofusca]|uniref:IPT/TIG domain-containing protein n=1 Tax=Kitasatospora purpeofusca TaxID=67352 RepID=UPI00386E758A